MLIEAKNVTLGYEHKPVLSNVNFSVNAGDYVVIVGENGAGKSTLLKGLLGLLKPRTGSFVTGDGLRRRQIGYLPQQTPMQRDFPASVQEVVISGCLNSMPFRPFYGRQQLERAEKAMKRLGIWEKRTKPYRALSGGQQQRVLLARALCAADSLLLLDEPVTGLDPQASEEMYDVIRSLKQDGTAIIMISHDVGTAIRDADTVITVADRTCIVQTKQAYLEAHSDDGDVA